MDYEDILNIDILYEMIIDIKNITQINVHLESKCKILC